MRVRAVVGNTIMVHIHDVKPGDVLAIRGDESDPIIELVERDREKVRLHYKQRPGDFFLRHSLWMDPDIGAHMFIADLRGERREFQSQ
jgi:hypothetical protein